MERSFKTPDGTELPLLEIKGKPYLNVKYRIVWFREENPKCGIETEIIHTSQDSSLAKATIKDTSGRVLATGHKTETKQGFIDHLEKAESGAIGRALGFLGYGTEFALELEEGDRLADAPAEEKPKAEKHRPSIMDLAKFTITFGPHINKQLQDVDPESLLHSIEKASQWLQNNPKHRSVDSVLEFVDTARRYLNYSKSAASDDFNDPKKPLPNFVPGKK